MTGSLDGVIEALFMRNTPLEEILRHDPPIEILSALRKENSKVVNYFCRSSTILQLFEVLLSDKPNDDDGPIPLRLPSSSAANNSNNNSSFANGSPSTSPTTATPSSSPSTNIIPTNSDGSDSSDEVDSSSSPSTTASSSPLTDSPIPTTAMIEKNSVDETKPLIPSPLPLEEDHVPVSNGTLENSTKVKDAVIQKQQNPKPLPLGSGSLVDVWKEQTLLVCNILTSDVPLFLDMVVRLEFLDALFVYLRKPGPLVPPTTDYFLRVVEYLFQMRPNNMFDYVKKREQLLPSLVKHIQNDSVLKLLRSIIKNSCERAEDKPRLETLQWLSLASVLVNQLFMSEDSFHSETFSNTVDFMIHLIDSYTMEQFAPFMSQLQNENLVRKIVEKTLLRYKETTTCIGCLKLLIKLLDSHKTGDHRALIADQITQLYQDYMGEAAAYTRQPPAIVYEIISQSHVITSILKSGTNPYNSHQQNSSNPQMVKSKSLNTVTASNSNEVIADSSINGTPPKAGSYIEKRNGFVAHDEAKFPPQLGSLRFTVVQLVSSLLKTNYCSVDAFLKEQQLLWLCFDLFFFYTQNSLLHDTIVNITKELFSKQTHKDLSLAAISEFQFHVKIMDAFKKKEDIENDPRVFGNHPKIPHYMGHLVVIANQIVDCIALKKYLQNNKRWEMFVTTTLARVNEIQKPMKPIIKDTCARPMIKKLDDKKDVDTSVWELFDEEFW